MVQGTKIMHYCIYIIIFSMIYIFVFKRNIYYKKEIIIFMNIRDLQYQLFVFLILYNFLYYNYFMKQYICFVIKKVGIASSQTFITIAIERVFG